MSSKDALLHYWLSEKQIATRQQLRRAWKGLSLSQPDGCKLDHTLNRLCRSGHLERNSDGSVSICPPVVLLTNDARTFATGARSLALRRELLQRLPESSFTCHGNETYVWQLHGDIATIRDVAEKLGLRVVEDRGLELMKSLPAYHQLLDQLNTSEELPASVWQHACWDQQQGCLLWRDMESAASQGIHRAKIAYRWRYVFRQENGSLKELITSAERAAGLWLCLRSGSDSLCYDSAAQSLQIDPGLFPPVLLDRALRMCSGLSPERTHGELRYSKVDLDRAQECARILCTPLRIE
jgi:hypothetical protein